LGRAQEHRRELSEELETMAAVGRHKVQENKLDGNRSVSHGNMGG
jgi:hypothetical protein